MKCHEIMSASDGQSVSRLSDSNINSTACSAVILSKFTLIGRHCCCCCRRRCCRRRRRRCCCCCCCCCCRLVLKYSLPLIHKNIHKRASNLKTQRTSKLGRKHAFITWEGKCTPMTVTCNGQIYPKIFW